MVLRVQLAKANQARRKKLRAPHDRLLLGIKALYDCLRSEGLELFEEQLTLPAKADPCSASISLPGLRLLVIGCHCNS